MRRASLPFFALSYCAISGCGLLFDTDALRSAGGAGDGTGAAASVTSTGGSGGAPTGAGGAGVPGGAGPNGGGGAGAAPGCEAGEAYCGPDSYCDADGLCTMVSAAVSSAEIVNVLFVEGSDEGHVVAQTKDSGVGVNLFSWTLGFSQDPAPMVGLALNDPGIGFIVAGGPDYVYYAGQLQDCDGDQAQDSCLTVCSINASGFDCFAPVPLTDGSQLNGAAMVRGSLPGEDRLYFVESSEPSNEPLLRISRECLETPGPPCPGELATNYNVPNDNLDPLGMDSDLLDGSVWWNTWGGSNLTGACVYQYPTIGDVAQCVQTVPDISYPSRLAVSTNSVFVGTFGTAGEAGPIQRLGRCMVGGQYPVTEINNVTWPADADGHFLYATSLISANELQVLNANTGALVKTLVGSEDAITSVDATHPDFLLFAAGNRIYRWRKPPAPCPSPAGEAVCGDGCVDAGEDCDDGNNGGEDGCNASCECKLPL